MPIIKMAKGAVKHLPYPKKGSKMTDEMKKMTSRKKISNVAEKMMFSQKSK